LVYIIDFYGKKTYNAVKTEVNMRSRINIFHEKKGKEKIAMLTCYDYSTARILSRSNIDSILVGDSLGMVFQGNKDTLPVTMDEMIYHTKTVRRGAPEMFIISDMPFLSYHISREEAIRNAGRFVQEGGADAVKLEGGEEVVDKIRGILAAKIPVMGHLGLTPQSVNLFGGFKVQGKNIDSARSIIKNAVLLENEGVFAIVLEGVPEKLASLISKKLKIPTIGIGAGRYTDGQILVINDIFGQYEEVQPKFAKQFSDVGGEMKKGIEGYIDEVKNSSFPDEKHGFSIDEDVIDALEKDVR
jgi:3-methyl-2-oxobutanoate hydroxymethyltransferase